MAIVNLDTASAAQRQQVEMETWFVCGLLFFQYLGLPYAMLCFATNFTDTAGRELRANMTSGMSHGFSRNTGVTDWYTTKAQVVAALVVIVWNAVLKGLHTRRNPQYQTARARRLARSRVLKIFAPMMPHFMQGRTPMAPIPNAAVTVAGYPMVTEGWMRLTDPMMSDRFRTIHGFRSDTIWPMECFALVMFLCRDLGLSHTKSRYIAFKFVIYIAMMVNGLSPANEDSPVEPYERGFLWDDTPLGA